MPGYAVRILNLDGRDVRTRQGRRICIGLPLPPGPADAVGRRRRFEASYLCEHPGHYLTGDGGYLDEDGYLFVMGRIDDVINVAGHRLSAGAIEAVLASHPAVAECAVIGVADEIKGQVPRGFVVLKAGASAEGLADELWVRAGRRRSARSPRSATSTLLRLPKTRSGKILRKTMRQIADGEPYKVPATIEKSDGAQRPRGARRDRRRPAGADVGAAIRTYRPCDRRAAEHVGM